MIQLSPESLWRIDERKLLDHIEKSILVARKKKIRFYAPSFMYYKTDRYSSSPNDFPTISVTGKGCALRCKHCGGVVLNTMYPVTVPDALHELCAQLKENGAKGCLISGGCLPSGAVPLGKFISTIARVKHELGLTVFVHTGVIDLQTANALKKAGVDAALIDIVGSDETIREICKLDVTVEDYVNSLKALYEAGIEFVPHVVVGLHYGKLEGELYALQMVSKYEPSALVIIAFMPIRGTEMENVKPPTPSQIAKVIAVSRLMFPRTPLLLGCMRPKDGKRAETEILAIKAGVDGIAFPTEQAIEFAESHGFELSFSSLCCSQIYADIRT